MQTLPAMLRFLFSHALIILLMFSTLPVQFSSTWEAHLSQEKYTPIILSLVFDTNPKKVSVQFCLLPSHIASDFIRFISRPENVENSAKVPSACCISCSSFKITLNRLHIVQLVWYFRSMYKTKNKKIQQQKTNAFLPLSMIFENQLRFRNV